MEYRFKTNINCGGCIAKVAPHLNGNKDIEKWSVETANPAKVLTVATSSLNESDVIAVIQKAGFTATSLNS